MPDARPPAEPPPAPAPSSGPLPAATLPPRLAALIDLREAAMLGRLALLSPQERAVFVLLGHAMRAKAIGYELAISAKTVETHLARIRTKLAGDAAPPCDLADLSFLARLWVRASG